jgi:hypothetical protein
VNLFLKINLTAMKKLSLFAFAIIAMGLVMCSDDNTVQPAATLTTDPSSGSGKPGEVVTVNIAFTAPNGAKELHIFVDGVEEDVVSLSGVASPTTYDYTVPADAAVGAVINLGFQIYDNANFPSPIANFTVNVGETLSGTIATNTTLDAAQQYILIGQVFVANGVTLTIPAGTIVKGDKASKATLIVQPGGKLITQGTANNPVVFTSALGVGARDRGDWGGIIILGNAFVNQSTKPSIEGITPNQTYGSSLAEAATPATNATENSGSIQYTRIEYAGIELTPNNETNSLTLGAVGNGTTVEYVQVSFGGDDGFEWFGGTVNAKHLISLSTWDDDFDTDFGFGGNVQFGLVVRNTFFADQSGSNGFESDNQTNSNTIVGLCDGATQVGCTRPVFSNMTMLGPREINSRTISANYQNAAHIRRRTSISIFNSYFAGWRIGIRLDDQGTLDNLTVANSLKLMYNVLSVPGATRVGTSTSQADANFATGLSGGDATALATYWTVTGLNTDFNNITAATSHSDIGVPAAAFWGASTSTSYPSNPDFRLVAGVAGPNNLNSGGDFTDGKVSGAFFTATTYRGAFDAITDWTDGWSEFQPINKVY